MLLAGALLLSATPAHAGTYTVYSCATPNGTPAPAEGWTADDRTGGGVNLNADACAGGGPMRAELHGGRQFAEGQYGDLVFTAPTGLPLVGYVLYRTAVVRQSGYGNYHYDLVTYDGGNPPQMRQPSDEACHVPCSVPSPPAPSDFSEQNSISRTTRASKLAVRVSCAPDSNTIAGQHPEVCNPVDGNATPAAAYIHRAELVLEDNSDPEFTSPPAGTLFDSSRELSGRVSASFAAKDTGSGVYQAIIEVDGQPVVTTPMDPSDTKCRRPFLHPRPCKTDNTAQTVELDTAVLPDGPHNVRLLVQDATGTNEIPYGPVSITTRNSVPGRGTPNGTNAADGAILQAGWKGRRSRELRTGFGRRVTIEGRLRNPAGQPIVGATVVLARTDLRLGAAEQTLTTKVTRADGSFSHRFRARPGMAIAVRYRAFAGDAGYSAQQGLTLRVRAGVTLRAPRTVRRGKRLRFSGRLLGGPIPRGGKLVMLQSRTGRRWQDSESARTDRRGRFRSSVPTNPAGGRGTVRVRIRVRREASYPYSTGFSRTRRVTLIP